MTESPWSDAWFGAALLALDPQWLGGAVVRARSGPVRDRWVERFRSLLPEEMTVTRLPAHITEDRLLGGLDLAATLNAGMVVAERGLLASSDRGVVVAPMAERLRPSTVAHLCSALDHGEVALERDGIAERLSARIALVALDEGIDDERVSGSLRDRLALHFDLDAIAPNEAVPIEDGLSAPLLAAARELAVDEDDGMHETLCRVAMALGIDSLRAPTLALRVARASALVSAKEAVDEEDLSLAARLVLAPRATRIPAPPEEESPPPPPPEENESSREENDSPEDIGRLEDRILEAVQSAMPAGLLAELTLAASRGAAATSGPAGATKHSKFHGRKVGSRRGIPRGGARLHVLETLRAAAPWQQVRRRARAPGLVDSRQARPGRIEVRKDDFRIHRFQERTETTTIFVVDASGSAALQRLAEAKGAVERVLADCYVRRDQVAMIAFRDDDATLVLSPTKSLLRAKRALAGLPGGGATPLAAGIDASLKLAHDCQRRGQTPVLVLMTDGRANVARDGTRGRGQAEEDALASARAIRAAGFAALFVDTGPRSQERARRIANEMGARYLHLPYSDVERISQTVQSVGASS
ncbi:MAG: magnesium chelatase subunit D [Myxococcota bacterium]